jgi:hypothetical protein
MLGETSLQIDLIDCSEPAERQLAENLAEEAASRQGSLVSC